MNGVKESTAEGALEAFKVIVDNFNPWASQSFAPPAGSAASSQYLARWMPEDGGKAVVIGDWYEVLTAATLFMEMGANKIEIETVRAMPPNDQAQRPEAK